ncbi:TPA: hypothetical protein ACPV0D_000626 [Vibrio parahaemolyticus]|uniref:Polysaccharide biosynthesis protein n=1 Tax=Vibrio parahaemolyticus TaxID=670 RepID=A0A5Q5AWW9_VIBPH|nr:hypothetical protein [Vibrio parahaemolyticus]EJG1730871.1 hypothetical protein [Vibrio parahaemolyticus]QEQ70679.1 polysaccharide biosynthesis protein [Vibrio parahaemolyticus]HCH1892002.1 hypothetical protein [Vibrio parahaemolyticus]
MKNIILLGYASRALSLSGGLIVLPFVLTFLSEEEFAIWMIFVAASSLVNVLDFGFSSSFSRYFNYVRGGCQSLSGDIISKQSEKCGINFGLYRTILDVAKKTYLSLGLFFVVISVALYYLYLAKIFNDNGVDFSEEWFVFSASLAINIFFLYYNALLTGLDKLDISYKATILSTITFLLISIALCILGLGLMGLCMAKLISILVFRLYCHIEIGKVNDYRLILKSQRMIENVKPVFESATKVGFATIGNFLTNRASVFVVGAYLSLSDVAMFSLSSMLFATLVSVSMIVLNSYSPKIGKELVSSDGCLLKHYLFSSLGLGNAVFFLGSLCIIFLAPVALDLIGSNSQLPPASVLFLFAITFFLELNQQMSTTLLTLANRLNFVFSVFLFGVIYIILCKFALAEIGATVIVAIVCQLLSQSVFNNWYWPWKTYIVYRRRI